MKRPLINDHVARHSKKTANHVSIQSDRSPEQAMLSMIAMSFLVLFLMTVSCQPSRNGEAVDYGPEASNADLNKALVDPIQDLDLDSLAVGQFVHFSTTDILAGGQVNQVESDTGQTIVDRVDQPEMTQFAVVQNKFTYGNSAPQKASTEFQLNIGHDQQAPISATPTPTPTPATPLAATAASALQTINVNSKSSFASSSTDVTRARVMTTAASTASKETMNLSQRLEWLKNDPQAALSLRASLKSFAIRKLNEIRMREGVKTLSDTTPATIHRLHSWEALESAPDLVKAQSGCLGIPNCQIRVRHIQFDQVSWEQPGGSKVSFDLAMSPDVPLISGYKMTPIFEYYPGLIRSCVTLMIPVGSKGSETLLTQCNATENFAFTAATATP